MSGFRRYISFQVNIFFVWLSICPLGSPHKCTQLMASSQGHCHDGRVSRKQTLKAMNEQTPWFPEGFTFWLGRRSFGFGVWLVTIASYSVFPNTAASYVALRCWEHDSLWEVRHRLLLKGFSRGRASYCLWWAVDWRRSSQRVLAKTSSTMKHTKFTLLARLCCMPDHKKWQLMSYKYKVQLFI